MKFYGRTLFVLALAMMPLKAFAQDITELPVAGGTVKLPIDVIVRYEFLRDSGAVGGGTWLQETGSLIQANNTFVTVKVGEKYHLIPYAGIKHIEYAEPRGK